MCVCRIHDEKDWEGQPHTLSAPPLSPLYSVALPTCNTNAQRSRSGVMNTSPPYTFPQGIYVVMYSWQRSSRLKNS